MSFFALTNIVVIYFTWVIFIGNFWVANLELTLKRSQMEIFAEILEVCKQPATKYKVLRNVYLPWCTGNDYLRSMMSAGLLNNDSSISCYLTTAKGHVFLEKWNELDKLLNDN